MSCLLLLGAGPGSSATNTPPSVQTQRIDIGPGGTPVQSGATGFTGGTYADPPGYGLDGGAWQYGAVDRGAAGATGHPDFFRDCALGFDSGGSHNDLTLKVPTGADVQLQLYFYDAAGNYSDGTITATEVGNPGNNKSGAYTQAGGPLVLQITLSDSDNDGKVVVRLTGNPYVPFCGFDSAAVGSLPVAWN